MPQKIAEIIGVSASTVRSQIKSIYGKTGVKRQSELIRRLLSHAEPSLQRDWNQRNPG
jgi:DNA-binding CsgD family transcriptional regulator